MNGIIELLSHTYNPPPGILSVYIRFNILRPHFSITFFLPDFNLNLYADDDSLFEVLYNQLVNQFFSPNGKAIEIIPLNNNNLGDQKQLLSIDQALKLVKTNNTRLIQAGKY